METPNTTQAQDTGELARFLNEHPGLTPVFSDDAVLCGFRLGIHCLSLDNVQELFYVPRDERLARFAQASPQRAGV